MLGNGSISRPSSSHRATCQIKPSRLQINSIGPLAPDSHLHLFPSLCPQRARTLILTTLFLVSCEAVHVHMIVGGAGGRVGGGGVGGGIYEICVRH